MQAMIKAKNKKPTLCLVIEQGFGARVLLQTDILKNLLTNKFEICILTSGYQSIRKYLDQLGITNIPVHQMETHPYHQRSQKLLIRLLRFTRLYSLKTQTMADSLELQIKDSKLSSNVNNKIFIRLVQILVILCRANIRIAKLLVVLENKLATVKGNQEFFRKYQPDILITTSIGNFDHDDYILREAKAENLKTITYILGWDNTSTRGHGVGLSDQIITWSDIMKAELHKIHGIKSSKIHIGGVSHYDSYSEKSTDLWDREYLYRELGIKPHKKLIVFGTKSPSSYKSNPDVVRAICTWIDTEPELKDYVVVCRLHPIYFRDNRNHYGEHFGENWSKLSSEFGTSKLIIDYPEIIDGDLNYFMPEYEMAKLGSLLKHSSVSINMFSTLNLEASIFDVPCINVAFQNEDIEITGFKQSRYNIKVDQNKTHTQRLIKTNATTLANNYDELKSALKTELAVPQSKSSYRKDLVRQECSNLGSGGQIVSDLIMNLSLGLN